MKQLRPLPDVTPILKRLLKTDLTLGVVTMGPQVKQAEKILRLGLIDYFDPAALFISDQIGIGKPNVKLYRKACQRLDISPEEAMYIGDNAPNDIDPPNELGMATVLVRRDGKYAGIKGVTEPDHSIDSFEELPAILCATYGISVPD